MAAAPPGAAPVRALRVTSFPRAVEAGRWLRPFARSVSALGLPVWANPRQPSRLDGVDREPV